MRRIVALFLFPLIAGLALVGCGSSKPPSANASVSATGKFGAAPKVTIPKEKASSTLAVKTLVQGKGAAIQTGLREARGEFAAIFDADLEYDPADLGVLMPPLLEGKTNACFGVRVFDGYTSHSFMFVMGNKGVTLACNVLFNVYLHDIMTCHKMIRTDLFRSLDLHANGFTIEPEITARLVQHGEKIFEVPVHYRARSSDEGKKLTARDGFRVIGALLKLRLRPPRRG